MIIKIWSRIHCAFAAFHLKDQLIKLGYNARVVADWDQHDESLYVLYQVSGCVNLPKNYILMQTEPWHSHWFSKHYQEIIKNALAVWDYREENFQAYEHKIRAIVEPGIKLQPKVKKTIKYLFYGWLEGSPRRVQKLRELETYFNHKIEVVTMTTGREMWDLLSKTKMVINIHYNEKGPREMYRICESLSHRCKVFTERDGFGYEIIDKHEDNLEQLKQALKSIENESILQKAHRGI